MYTSIWRVLWTADEASETSMAVFSGNYYRFKFHHWYNTTSKCSPPSTSILVKGNLSIKGVFNGKSYELQVTTLQAVVLMAFNDCNSWDFLSLQSITGINVEVLKVWQYIIIFLFALRSYSNNLWCLFFLILIGMCSVYCIPYHAENFVWSKNFQWIMVTIPKPKRQ